MRTALLVAIFVFQFGLCFAGDSLVCPKCDRQYATSPKYCSHDGCKLKLKRQALKGCPRCQKSFHHGEKFCPFDGVKLELRKPLSRRCKTCRRVFSGGEVFCPTHGTRLEALSEEQAEPQPKKPTTQIIKNPKPIDDPRTRPDETRPDETRPDETKASPEDSSQSSDPEGKPKVAKLQSHGKTRSYKFAATNKSTAVLPFRMAKPGLVQFRANFRGNSEVILVVHAPGQVKPIARKQGISPLALDIEIGEGQVNASKLANKAFEVWVVLSSGASALGQLSITTPKISEPKASDKKTEKRDKDVIAFELGKKGTYVTDIDCDKLGRLELHVSFPAGREVVAILTSRNTRKKLLEKRGSSPLSMVFQATPKHKRFQLLLIDFSRKPLKGKIKVSKPS